MRLVQPLATKGYKVVDKNSLTDFFGIGKREGHLDSNLNLGHAMLYLRAGIGLEIASCLCSLCLTLSSWN